MKIVVHAPNWVGDHVMAYPFYRLLPELFPNASLTLIGRSWISSLQPKTFHKIIAFDAKKNFSSEIRNQLKTEKFDIGFTLSPSFRSALLLFRLGCRLRIGFREQLRTLLLKFPPERGALRIPPVNRLEHRSLSYLRLLTPFFPAELVAEEYLARLGTVTEKFTEDKNFLNTELGKQFGNAIRHKVPVLAICPGSVAPSKIYPIHHLIQVIANFLAQDNRRTVILVGSGIEKEYAARIRKAFPQEANIIDITGKTSLEQLGYLLSQTSVLVANDSGVGHLSTLTGTPLVSFQGMGRKEETVPLNPRKVIFHLQLPCSPCFKKECPRWDKPLECLEGIPPQAVSAAIENFLRATHYKK